MAKSVNKVFLLGNVGKDPEIRSTRSGTMVANFHARHQRSLSGRAGQLAGPHRVAQSGRLQAHRRDRPRLCEEGFEAVYRGQDPDAQLGRQGDQGQALPHRNHRQRSLAALRARRFDRAAAGTAVRRARRMPRSTRTSACPRRRTTLRSQPKSPTTIFRSKEQGHREQDQRRRSENRAMASVLTACRPAHAAAEENSNEKALRRCTLRRVPGAARAGDAPRGQPCHRQSGDRLQAEQPRCARRVCRQRASGAHCRAALQVRHRSARRPRKKWSRRRRSRTP